MKNSKSHLGIIVTLSVLLIGILCLVIAQVLTANKATQLETTLFNVLQFLTSLAFAWILSRIVTESSYLESQRKFAIGAFRRIKEIERSLARTNKYVTKAIIDSKDNDEERLDTIRASLMNAQDTVKSSIADWSDIIGNEIEVANEIERLKAQQDDVDESGVDKVIGRQESQHQLAPSVSNKIAELVKDLPPELRLSIENRDDDDFTEEAKEYLAEQWKEKKGIELRAFWSPADTLKKNLDDISVGDTVFVARGITEHRDGALLVYDNNDNWIGVVLNDCFNVGCGYNDFIRVLEEFFGRPLLPRMFAGNPIAAVVTDVEQFDTELERQYFTVFIDKLPYHECAHEGMTLEHDQEQPNNPIKPM